MTPEIRMVWYDERLHELSSTVIVSSPSTIQALAWWVAAELIRRHPHELMVVEAQPASGLANALILVQRDDPDQNTLARLWFTPEPAYSTPHDEQVTGHLSWLEILLAPNRRTDVVERIEIQLGLQAPRQTPPTDVRSIGPRVLAAFLQRTTLERPLWAVSNGAYANQDDAGARNDLFASMPAVRDDRSGRYAGVDEYRASQHYWFIGPVVEGKARTPVAAINTAAGLAWHHGQRFDLLDLYERANRHIDAVVNSALPRAL